MVRENKPSNLLKNSSHFFYIEEHRINSGAFFISQFDSEYIVLSCHIRNKLLVFLHVH